MSSSHTVNTSTRPPFDLYIVWHPACAAGPSLGERLRQHFGGDRFRDVAGGLGLGVIYRNENAPRKAAPLPVDWDGSESTAVVVLVDANLDRDAAWRDYVRELARIAQSRGYQDLFFPVMMETGKVQMQFEEQMLCWDHEGETDTAREHRLVRSLTHEFCRMLRHRLQSARELEGSEPSLDDYRKPVQAFISHSKHDKDGEPLAKRIRDWLHEHSAMSSFFDVYDLPPGVPFKNVLQDSIDNSAVMVVHTDSYSSREWCRREVVRAKRSPVPMVILDCLRDFVPRSMPYMGNVPIIRMNPGQNRIAEAIGHLLNEVFRTFVWLCRVQPFKAAHPDVRFTARPPELVALASPPVPARGASSLIVHPEPTLDSDAAELFAMIAPDTRIRTLTKWLEEVA